MITCRPLLKYTILKPIQYNSKRESRTAMGSTKPPPPPPPSPQEGNLLKSPRSAPPGPSPWPITLFHPESIRLSLHLRSSSEEIIYSPILRSAPFTRSQKDQSARRLPPAVPLHAVPPTAAMLTITTCSKTDAISVAVAVTAMAVVVEKERGKLFGDAKIVR